MERLRYVLEHVFMPPKLPQTAGDPLQESAMENVLATYVHDCAKAFQSLQMGSTFDDWDPVVSMLRKVMELHTDVPYSASQVAQRLADMVPGDVLALLVRKQNAGLMIRRTPDDVVFEIFEVSAPSGRVVQSEGKLRWTFPGSAVSIPTAHFIHADFRRELAIFIAAMNSDELGPAAKEHENRDVAVHPKYISNLLMTILAALGGGNDAIVMPSRQITKRIGDDALSEKGYTPWRRSPLWLVIRVAMQTTLADPNNYKSFMIYFMSGLMTSAIRHKFESTTLEHMSKKITWRAAKLGDSIDSAARDEATRACIDAHTEINARWEAIKEAESEPLQNWAPYGLEVDADTRLQLNHATPYISSVLYNTTALLLTSSYVPKHASRLRDSPFHEMLREDLKLFGEDKDTSLALADFEAAVCLELNGWIEMCLSDSGAPLLLYNKIRQYSDLASKQYKDNSEQLSGMVLVVLELWVALDKIVTDQYPLLLSYPPEVPISLLEPLLFRSARDLARVRDVASYIQQRAPADNAHPSLFGTLSPFSFSTKYYASSRVMRDAKEAIVKKANKKKKEKLTELLEKNKQYSAWQAKCLNTAHSEECKQQVRKRKRTYCPRCMLNSEVISIGRFEWPLPEDDLHIQNMIFELYCPTPIALWREATYFILYEQFTSPEFKSSGQASSTGVQSYMSSIHSLTTPSSSTNRLGLYSKTTGGNGSVHLPVTSLDVCVKHQKDWHLYDSLGRVFLDFDQLFHRISDKARTFHRADTTVLGTLTLPQSMVYNGLQYAVSGTSHTENQVQARQASCPYDLSLHEYLAFGTMRAGSVLQWMNVAKAFATRSLTFNAQPVHVLISQAVQQLGKLHTASGVPRWHVELRSPSFCESLLGAMRKVLDDSVDNWREVASVKTIILVVIRLLSGVNEEGTPVTIAALEMLATARATTYKWLKAIIGQLETTPQNEVDAVKARICEIAGTCCLSFDVDNPELSAADIAIFIHASIAINSNSPSKRDTSAAPARLLLDRVQRLMHSLENELWAHISEDSQGLDEAVKAVWSAYVPGTPWQRMPKPNDRWLFCKTRASNQVQNVQINLLSGELFIDGKPIGNLPKRITEDPVYERLFGKAVLRVVPAGVAEMDYKSVLDISGYEVFFAAKENGPVVIRARRMAVAFDTFLEYVPFDHFTGDLPVPLVEDYVHWLNLDSGVIELRPLKTLWTPSPLNWTIDFNGKVMKDHRGHCLIDANSPTFQMIYQRLRAFEDASFIVMTKSNEDELEIHLPRFRLDFYMDPVDGELISKTYPNNVVDEDQSPETLYGLKSKLTLRDKSSTGDADIHPVRRVLIPRGLVKFQSANDGNHVEVLVDTDVGRKRSVQYLEYTVNKTLGMLVGNGSLDSRLYKIYLHALTSHCVPDPLLGRTGVEEALNELASASCFSFQSLDIMELEILALIRALTPRREYHPPRKQETQAVRWLEIPPTCQVTAFERVVKSILVYNEKLKVFIESPPEPTAEKKKEYQHSPPTLLTRAAAREYPFLDVLTLPDFKQIPDESYMPRDNLEECSDWAYAAAQMVLKKDPTKFPVQQTPRLYEMFKDDWNPMTHADLEGEPHPLSYSRRWLGRNDFGRSFLPLYEHCLSPRLSRDKKMYSCLFSFPALAFGGSTEARLLPYLAALALLPERFAQVVMPRYKSFKLEYGTYPRTEDISPVVRRYLKALEETPAEGLMQLGDEDDMVFEVRRRKHYNEQAHAATVRLVKQVLELFTTYTYLTIPALPNEAQHNQYHHVAHIMEVAEGIFQNCWRNGKLRAFATSVQDVLTPMRIPTKGDQFPSLIQLMAVDGPEPQPRTTSNIPTVQRLMRAREAPSLDDHVLTDLSTPENRAPPGLKPTDPSVVALEKTLDEFSDTTVPLQTQYGQDMLKSLERLKASLAPRPAAPVGIDIGDHLDKCRTQYVGLRDALQWALAAQSEEEMLLEAGRMWPSRSIRAMLFQMTRAEWSELSKEWQTFLATFAIALVRLQQAERLASLNSVGKKEEIEREVGNMRLLEVELFMQHPDWLLIMIEHNFFARAIQIQVALEMFSPSSGNNTALQLNMGEGKSSVIAPMVAASLADGLKLVRIVVLKPLAKQMLQLFVDRLSSLPNRRICYFPFTRQMKSGPGCMTQIHNLNMQCTLDGAVVIVQPEHILSAKLLTIDKLLSMTEGDVETHSEASDALQAQHWIEDHSRDIFDESDEVLHVRYQLIYTKGTQCAMEGHPDRWTITQDVLRLAARVIDEVSQNELGMEVRRSAPWAFPHVKIPEQDSERIIEDILSKLVDAVMDEELKAIAAKRFSPAAQKSLAKYITHRDANNEGVALRRYLSRPTFNAVLIVRGLLVYGLLLYVIQDRRWRVDYGLDLSRLMLAVPYRAKDLPSLRSEFGHPDIAILLTCLAYYYHGLNKTQMNATIKHLLILSNPVDHYAQWVSNIPDADLPAGLRDLNGMNVDDGQQRDQVFELFRYNRIVIDFYLANIVFPKAAKEFPHKLPTSGWDLAETKTNVTTGFSGTNDNRYLLPTSIRQEDPVDQGGTNALVLTYLLRPENASYTCTRNANGKSFTGLEIIKHIAKRNSIRVLLDVGAQMLDMSNQKLVETWLALLPPDSGVEAAIFFNSNDELTTITRSGTVELLISSPFKQQTSKCIVYLDDAHTRGTDLKLPTHWQAAVTLGKKVTKDRLVQGVLRMRQMGRGQSVAIYAPPEIDASIRRHFPALQKPRSKVQISHVIQFCMLETCGDIEHHFGQWVQQGVDFDVRSKALKPLRKAEALSVENVKPVEKVWMQKEARKLSEMYEGGPSEPLGRYMRRYPLLQERLKVMGLEAMVHDNMDEEQEREVIHEMEVERHPERPPPVEHAKHALDTDVVNFVKTGILDVRSPGFCSIPTLLDSIPGWHEHAASTPFDDHFLTTTDFAITMKHDTRRAHREFWKQTQWILSTNVGNTEPYLVLISQWEAHNILYIIRNKGHLAAVRLHLYCPRVTKSAQIFDDLAFYSVPPLQPTSPRPSRHLVMQLNIFAGQLYPSSFDEYASLCRFLGVVSTETLVSQADGFVVPANRKDHMENCPFVVSPVGFLKELMSSRRKGHDFALTPMGKILNGYRLSEEDFN